MKLPEKFLCISQTYAQSSRIKMPRRKYNNKLKICQPSVSYLCYEIVLSLLTDIYAFCKDIIFYNITV